MTITTHFNLPVAAIYPLGWECPKGYEITGEFRPPKDNFESYIRRVDGRKASEVRVGPPSWGGIYCPLEPRIILRKLKTKIVTFRPTGEVRPAKNGEWYSDNPAVHDSSPPFWRHTGNWPTVHSYPIWTRTESEE